MRGILIAKIQGLIRNPGLFIVMTVMSIIFAFIVGSLSESKVTVPVFLEEGMQTSKVMEILRENETFDFKEEASAERLEEKVSHLKAEFGVVLSTTGFQMIASVNSPNVVILEQVMESAYIRAEQWKGLKGAGASNLDNVLPVFEVSSTLFQGEDSVIHDDALFRLFGFTMFFVIYTIAYSVLQILIEKRSGVWDRMILSSVHKWEMYVGNFLYSFLIGYIQVVIVFVIFRFIVQVDFHGAFLETLLLLIPYVLAIVSLFILVTGMVKTVQQFNAVNPIIAVSMAMIGGAYWPLEIVDSKVMLLLSKVNPITYGLEALQGVAVYGQSLSDVLFPVSILLLMSVALTGVGIHLMEKRYVN